MTEAEGLTDTQLHSRRIELENLVGVVGAGEGYGTHLQKELDAIREELDRRGASFLDLRRIGGPVDRPSLREIDFTAWSDAKLGQRRHALQIEIDRYAPISGFSPGAERQQTARWDEYNRITSELETRGIIT